MYPKITQMTFEFLINLVRDRFAKSDKHKFTFCTIFHRLVKYVQIFPRLIIYNLRTDMLRVPDEKFTKFKNIKGRSSIYAIRLIYTIKKVQLGIVAKQG